MPGRRRRAGAGLHADRTVLDAGRHVGAIPGLQPPGLVADREVEGAAFDVGDLSVVMGMAVAHGALLELGPRHQQGGVVSK